MEKGYKLGLISTHDICDVAQLYEPNTAIITLNKFLCYAKDDVENKQLYQNLKFLLKIAGYILSNKNEEVNFAVRIYLLDLITTNFDANYSYNWQELKSIFFYCKYTSNMQSFKDFASKLKSNKFNGRLCTYALTDSIFENRRRVAQKVVENRTR